MAKSKKAHERCMSEWIQENDSIDTSFLYRSLREEYLKNGESVEVDFRKLVDWIKLGDQLTHQIHSYPAKLLPNIAHFFCRAKTLYVGHKTLIDPFSGSGTVALEGSLAGFDTFVLDANPLAALVTKVKTIPYNPQELLFYKNKILQHVKTLRKAPVVDVVNHHLWYFPESKRKLELLLKSIRSIVQEKEILDFFLVCFSAVARKLSLADPAISVPVRIKEKVFFTTSKNEKIKKHIEWVKNEDPVQEFSRICQSNMDRIAQTNGLYPNRKAAIVIGNDAKKLSSYNIPRERLEGEEGVSLIITSPPYGSAQKYIRASSLSLNWLGYATPHELAELEAKSIGREHLPRFRECARDVELSPEFESLLARVEKKNKLRAGITRQYLYEMRVALVEMSKAVIPGGYAILVVGNNSVCGEPLRNDKFIIEVMAGLGMKMELMLIDNIKSRGLMVKRNKTASVISRESVLVFKK